MFVVVVKSNMPAKLKDHQLYTLLWALEADERYPGSGIAKNHSIPPLVETKSFGRVSEIYGAGISMSTVRGLEKRGYLQGHGYADSFFTITDSGRNALEACRPRIMTLIEEQAVDNARERLEQDSDSESDYAYDADRDNKD